MIVSFLHCLFFFVRIDYGLSWVKVESSLFYHVMYVLFNYGWDLNKMLLLYLILLRYLIADAAALPKVFAHRNIYGIEYVIVVGGLCGLSAAMMGSIFPLPRTIYAMAQDGLLFRWLGCIHPKTNTPVAATLISGIMAAVLGMVLRLESLVEMMSIGTLMAYTLVAMSVMVLRYIAVHTYLHIFALETVLSFFVSIRPNLKYFEYISLQSDRYQINMV